MRINYLLCIITWTSGYCSKEECLFFVPIVDKCNKNDNAKNDELEQEPNPTSVKGEDASLMKQKISEDHHRKNKKKKKKVKQD